MIAFTALTLVASMTDLKVAATLSLGKTADWVAVTPEKVWVGSTGPYAVNEIDPQTNQFIRVELPGEPCAGLALDAQSLWVPLCGTKSTKGVKGAKGVKPKLAKVDLKTHALQVFDVGPAGPEGGVTIGAGSVWLVTDKKGSLARIDPATGSITQTVHVPPGSFNPRFADGHVWVTRVNGAELTSVDPASGKVVSHHPTGKHPRFLTSGAGAVWTLNQGSGTISRIGTAGKQPTVTIPVNMPGPGGDIAYGEGRIWSTSMATRKVPLSIVDAATSTVLCQWEGPGGDSLGVGFGSVWLTDYHGGTLSRIALSDLPAECAAR
jgi:streptogramin lyase